MSTVRRSFFNTLADGFRALGRRSLVLPRGFSRLADWCEERAR